MLHIICVRMHECHNVCDAHVKIAHGWAVHFDTSPRVVYDTITAAATFKCQLAHRDEFKPGRMCCFSIILFV